MALPAVLLLAVALQFAGSSAVEATALVIVRPGKRLWGDADAMSLPRRYLVEDSIAGNQGSYSGYGVVNPFIKAPTFTVVGRRTSDAPTEEKAKPKQEGEGEIKEKLSPEEKEERRARRDEDHQEMMAAFWAKRDAKTAAGKEERKNVKAEVNAAAAEEGKGEGKTAEDEEPTVEELREKIQELNKQDEAKAAKRKEKEKERNQALKAKLKSKLRSRRACTYKLKLDFNLKGNIDAVIGEVTDRLANSTAGLDDIKVRGKYMDEAEERMSFRSAACSPEEEPILWKVQVIALTPDKESFDELIADTETVDWEELALDAGACAAKLKVEKYRVRCNNRIRSQKYDPETGKAVRRTKSKAEKAVNEIERVSSLPA